MYSAKDLGRDQANEQHFPWRDERSLDTGRLDALIQE